MAERRKKQILAGGLPCQPFSASGQAEGEGLIGAVSGSPGRLPDGSSPASGQAEGEGLVGGRPALEPCGLRPLGDSGGEELPQTPATMEEGCDWAAVSLDEGFCQSKGAEPGEAFCNRTGAQTPATMEEGCDRAAVNLDEGCCQSKGAEPGEAFWNRTGCCEIEKDGCCPQSGLALGHGGCMTNGTELVGTPDNETMSFGCCEIEKDGCCPQSGLALGHGGCMTKRTELVGTPDNERMSFVDPQTDSSAMEMAEGAGMTGGQWRILNESNHSGVEISEMEYVPDTRAMAQDVSSHAIEIIGVVKPAEDHMVEDDDASQADWMEVDDEEITVEKTVKKKSLGRPRKRGVRSVETEVTNSLILVGARNMVLETHNKLRKEPKNARRVLHRANEKDCRQRKRASKAMEGSGSKGSGPVAKKPKKNVAPPKHFLHVAEELEPAVYGNFEKGVGRKTLKSFIRDAGKPDGGLGKRYQLGPKCSEAELNSIVAGLSKRRAVGPASRNRQAIEELDSLKNRIVGWKEEEKEAKESNNSGRLSYLQGRFAWAESEQRRLLADITMAEMQLGKDKAAKVAFYKMWYRRCKASHIGYVSAARKQRLQKMDLAFTLAKVRCTGRPDLKRRLDHLKAAARERTLRLTETRRLIELTGKMGRLQTGHRAERIRKQQRYQTVVVEGIYRRSLAKLVVSGETDKKVKEEAKAKTEKLKEKAAEVVAMAFGCMEEALRVFVNKYKRLEWQSRRLKKDVGKRDKEGNVQTLESLLRPLSAQKHRKWQEPFNWKPPKEPELETDSQVARSVMETVGSILDELDKREGAEGQDVTVAVFGALQDMLDTVEDMEDEVGPGAVSVVDEFFGMMEEAEAAEEAKKAKDSDTAVWGVGDNAVCGKSCVLPPQWALRLGSALARLRMYSGGNVWQCMKSFMKIQACSGCFTDLTLPCLKGDECEDAVKLCLEVRPHSTVVEDILRSMVYPASRCVKRYMLLVKVMKKGTVEELEDLVKSMDKPQQAKGGAGGSTDDAPGLVIRADEIMQLYGRHREAFRKVEEDHPVHPCFWCEQLYTVDEMTVMGMKTPEDKVPCKMSAEARENLKSGLKRRMDLTGKTAKEVFPMNICHFCIDPVKKGGIGPRMVENGFHTDVVPPELSCLNAYEEKLVCLVSPFYEVVVLRPYAGKVPNRLLMKGTRGNVIHLKIPIEETVEHVVKTAADPKPVAFDPARSLRIYADVKTRKGKSYRNIVNMEKVVAALEWLVSNNPLYSKVRLDKEALLKMDLTKIIRLVHLERTAEVVDPNLEQEAPEEDQVEERERFPHFLTQDKVEHQIVGEFSTAPIARAKVAVDKDLEVYKQTDIKSEVVWWKKVPDLDLQCFPMLFPKGRDGTFSTRNHRVRPPEVYKYRLRSMHSRYRRKQMYIHFSKYHKRERALDSGVYASVHRNSASAKLTVGQLKAKLEGKDKDVESLNRDLRTALQKEKGSAEYWKKVAGNMNVQDDELGPTTLFMTFSSAETKWPALFEELRALNKDLPNVERMSQAELCVADPVGVAQFFHRRFSAFFREYILASDGPVGDITHFFWRLEYQARGAPHIHMKGWLDNAPILGHADTTPEMVRKFIDGLITCKIPLESENAELRRLVLMHQIHKCTKSCNRPKTNKKGKWYTKCRHGFPKPVSERTEIHGIEEAVLSKGRRKGGKRLYTLRRASGEEYVNPYNPALLMDWGGNMDIQYVGEKSGILNRYLSGYMSKSECQNTTINWEALDADKSVPSRLRSVVNQLNREKEIGTIEAVDDLLGHQLYSSSETVEWLTVGPEARRTRTYKPIADIRALGPDSKDIFQPSMIDDHYPKRHKDLEELSLYRLAKTWKYEKKGPKHDVQMKNDKERFERTHKMCGHQMGYLVKRDKEVLLNYFRVSPKAENAEQFFEILLQLHVPWREEAELLRGKKTLAEAYEEWKDLFPEVEKHRVLKEEIQKAEDLRKLLEDKAARLEDEEAAEGDWPEGAEPQAVEAANPQGFRARPHYGTEEGLAESLASLNPKQREIYNSILSTVEHQMAHEEMVMGCESPEQVLLFVSGGAGTGKSHLIKTLAEGVELKSGRPVVIAAPTGLAAMNVDGKTLHRVFKLPVQKDGKMRYNEQSHEQDKDMAQGLYKTKLIIIDEISMVSNVTLAFIHQRLMEMMSRSGSMPPFAGFNVLVLGDLMQLPPVDRKILGYCFQKISFAQWKKAFPGSVVRNKGDGIWSEFRYAELTENMRQRGDRLWADLLNEMRFGDMDKANEYLEKRVWVDSDGKTGLASAAALIKRLLEEGKKPVCLVPKVALAASVNASVIAALGLPAKYIHARDMRSGTKTKAPSKGSVDIDLSKDGEAIIDYLTKYNSINPKSTGGLPGVLILGVGTRVMLTYNVEQEMGLVNGAMGTVTKLLMSLHSKDRVAAIRVHFDNDTEDTLIERVTGVYEPSPQILMERSQFPLIPAYAITIHKSQGMSLPCVIIYAGQSFEAGQDYVAYSRCETLEETYLMTYDKKGVFCDPVSVGEYNRLRGLYEKDLPKLKAAPRLPGGSAQIATVVKRAMEQALAIDGPLLPNVKKSRPSVVQKFAGELLPKTPAEKVPSSKKKKNEAKNVGTKKTEKKKTITKKAKTKNAEPEEKTANAKKSDVKKTRAKMADEKKDETKKAEDRLTSSASSGFGFVPLLNQKPGNPEVVENICFCNSAVQGLLSLECVRQWFLRSVSGLGPEAERAFNAMSELVKAGMGRSTSDRDTRVIRNAVDTFQQRHGNMENFSNGHQHCAMELLMSMMDMLDDLKKLFRFVWTREIECLRPGCTAGRTFRMPDEPIELTLSLPVDKVEVTWDELLKAHMEMDVMQRCHVCCPDRYVRGPDGQNMDNEGFLHAVHRRVESGDGQRAMLVRVTRYYTAVERNRVRPKRSPCQLVGLNTERVEFSGVTFRVVGAVFHSGQTTSSGHYVAYARTQSGWRYMSDTESRETDTLPMTDIYIMVLERTMG